MADRERRRRRRQQPRPHAPVGARRRDRRRRHGQGDRAWWRVALLAGDLSLDVEYDLRTGVYRHLLTLEQHYHDDHQTGQLLSRATADVTAIRVFLGYGLIFITQYVAARRRGHRAADLDEPAARARLVRARAAHDLALGPLLAAVVPDPARRAAARRRRDDAGRGGDRRRARDQGLRAGGSRGRPLRAALRGRLPPAGRRHAPAGHLPAAARPRAAARRRDRALRGRARRGGRLAHDRRLLPVQPVPRACW